MKYILMFVIIALASIVKAVPRPDDDTYSTKYDNIDLDSILTNERLFTNYIACVEESGKCTSEGEELKKHFHEAIETCCSKCSEKQKKGAKKVFRYLEDNKTDKLKELRLKYDPTGEKEKKCREKYNL